MPTSEVNSEAPQASGKKGSPSVQPSLALDPRALARQFRAAEKPSATRKPGHRGFSNPEFPPEVVSAVEVEWRAGMKSVSTIAEEFGIPRQTIYLWQARHRWPARTDVRSQVQAAVNTHLVRSAVERYRAAAPADVRAHLEQITQAAGGDIGLAEDAAKSAALIDDYAKVVSDIILTHRKLAVDTLAMGEQLIEVQRAGLIALKAQHAGDPQMLAKLSKDFIASFQSLVRSIGAAITMQRAAFGMDAQTGGGEGVDAEKAGDPSQGKTQPGSYEDVVRAAEARGEPLV